MSKEKKTPTFVRSAFLLLLLPALLGAGCSSVQIERYYDHRDDSMRLGAVEVRFGERIARRDARWLDWKLLRASCAHPFGFTRLSAIPGYEFVRVEELTSFELLIGFDAEDAGLVIIRDQTGQQLARLSHHDEEVQRVTIEAMPGIYFFELSSEAKPVGYFFELRTIP